MNEFENKLSKCMNNINFNKDIKETILDNAEKCSVKEINKYSRRIYKRKVYKYAINIVACIVLFVVISFTGTYALSGKNVWEIFFNNAGKEYAKQLMDYNGQSYTIDDYTITLEQTLYDSRTTIGYCIFSVEKKEGKPEIELNKWGQSVTEHFGIDDRFSIEVFATGGCSCEFEFIEDILYAYVSFRVADDFDSTIYIIDSTQKDNSTVDGYKWYSYFIKESAKYKEYVINETKTLTLSPLGVAIDCETYEEVSLKLHYIDGTEEIVVDTGKKIGIGNAHEYSVDTKKRYQYVFEEIKDIERIDYIIFNEDIYKEK